MELFRHAYTMLPVPAHHAGEVVRAATPGVQPKQAATTFAWLGCHLDFSANRAHHVALGMDLNCCVVHPEAIENKP